MLTQEERQAIEAEFPHYETRRAVCIDALMIVQQREGWVSDEMVKDVAELLEMSPDEVDNVATFYNLIFRKPVGRHVILACDSVSCWLCGYEKLHAALRERLGVEFGGTTPDNRFTLLPIVCLGACERAPAMMIDDDLYGDVTPDQVDDLLARYE